MGEDQKINADHKRKLSLFSKLCVTLSILIVLLIVAIGAFFVRLHMSPLDIGFAKATIEQNLRNEKTGNYARIDNVVLHWPKIRGPLLLGIKGARVYNGQGQQIIAVDEAALSLNKASLLIGKVSPHALILKQPSVLVKRSLDNKFDIAFGQASESADDQKAVTASVLSNIAGGAPDGASGPLDSLLRFRIEDAQVVVDDAILGRSWLLPNFNIAFQRADEGLFAVFDVDFPEVSAAAGQRAARLEGNLLVDAKTRETALQVKLDDFDLQLLADKIPEFEALASQSVIADTELKAFFADDFSLRYVEIGGISARGVLDIPEWSDVPVEYTDFGFDALYDAVNKNINLRAVQLSAGGVTFNASGTLNHGVRDGLKGVSGSARVEIAEMAHDKLDPLWPASLKEDNAYKWIVVRMGEGVFKDVFAEFEVDARQDAQGAYDVKTKNVKAGFAFEGMSVDYRAPLAPVTGSSGLGVFDYDSEFIHVDITGGDIGGLSIEKARLEFYNIIESGAGVADLNMKLSGPLVAALRYIKEEPIDVDLDTDLEAVKGDVKLSANIEFPTKDELLAEEVDLLISGEMRDVVLPRVIKDVALSGGPFAFDIKDGLFTLSGQGALAGRPATLQYQEFLDSEGRAYQSRVSVQADADEEFRLDLGIDLGDFLKGPAAVDVEYTQFRDNTAVADVKANITPSTFFLDPFGYKKGAGVVGSARLKAHLKNDILREIKDLKVTAPNLALAPSVFKFRENNGETELASGQTGDFTVGQTQGRLDFKYNDAGILTLNMRGAFLDLRPFLKSDSKGKDEPYENPPMQVSVHADVMRTADDEVIRAGKIYADIDATGHFVQMEMDAVVGGQLTGSGDIYVRFKPDETGKRIFRLEADDAGAALKAFEVFDDLRGGKLVIYGEPIRGIYDRNLIGVAEITDFSVVRAPVVAKLLGALSLRGASEMLAGQKEGLSFSKLKADFDWLFRPNGSLLVVKDGRSSGNAMGLTFEGTVDNASGAMDISGTVVPLSGVNKVIGSIPLVGDILTGGSGGIFAATYKVKADNAEDEPKVSVNPLSVLAPGILRRILFE